MKLNPRLLLVFVLSLALTSFWSCGSGSGSSASWPVQIKYNTKGDASIEGLKGIAEFKDNRDIIVRSFNEDYYGNTDTIKASEKNGKKITVKNLKKRLPAGVYNLDKQGREVFLFAINTNGKIDDASVISVNDGKGGVANGLKPFSSMSTGSTSVPLTGAPPKTFEFCIEIAASKSSKKSTRFYAPYDVIIKPHSMSEMDMQSIAMVVFNDNQIDYKIVGLTKTADDIYQAEIDLIDGSRFTFMKSGSEYMDTKLRCVDLMGGVRVVGNMMEVTRSQSVASSDKPKSKAKSKVKVVKKPEPIAETDQESSQRPDDYPLPAKDSVKKDSPKTKAVAKSSKSFLDSIFDALKVPWAWLFDWSENGGVQ